VTPILEEARCTLQRVARRRAARGAALLDVALLGYAAVVRPVATARDAVSAASAVAALTVLVVAAGVIADDRERGRLALAATHPVPPGTWVAGRWLAVTSLAGAVLVVASLVLLGVAGAWRPPAGVALALAASLAHFAALSAVAVGLSCRVGATAQVLALLAVLIVGAVPPDVAATSVPVAWAGAAAQLLWAALPTSWALGRLHAWSLAGGEPAPLVVAALALQTAAWLAAGTRDLGRAELAGRGV
jgi:hypothetical protein